MWKKDRSKRSLNKISLCPVYLSITNTANEQRNCCCRLATGHGSVVNVAPHFYTGNVQSERSRKQLVGSTNSRALVEGGYVHISCVKERDISHQSAAWTKDCPDQRGHGRRYQTDCTGIGKTIRYGACTAEHGATNSTATGASEKDDQWIRSDRSVQGLQASFLGNPDKAGVGLFQYLSCRAAYAANGGFE